MLVKVILNKNELYFTKKNGLGHTIKIQMNIKNLSNIPYNSYYKTSWNCFCSNKIHLENLKVLLLPVYFFLAWVTFFHLLFSNFPVFWSISNLLAECFHTLKNLFCRLTTWNMINCFHMPFLLIFFTKTFKKQNISLIKTTFLLCFIYRRIKY